MAELRSAPGPGSLPKPRAVIAVMGQTGSGKSSFINLATRMNKLTVGHSITSCTSSVDVADPFEFEGREILLYDTPGFNDTTKTETEILKIIAAELEMQYRGGIKLQGVIYVHRISDVRVGGIDRSNFHIFRKLCGDTNLKNVVIMTNMWSEVSVERAERRVQELTTLDDFFKPALDKGASMVHNKLNTAESAYEVIRLILQNHPMPLVIQQEIVDEGKNIDQTSAGIEVDKKVAELVARYEKKLKEQMEAAEQAARERDEETRKELMEEANKAKAAIAKLEAERTNQAAEYQRFRKQLSDMEEQTKRDAEANKERLVSRSIVSGYTHTISSNGWAYPYLYLDPQRSSDLLYCYNFVNDAKYKWIFTRNGKNWRIQSAYNRRYLWVNPNAGGCLYLSVEPHDFLITPQDGYNQFGVTQLDGVGYTHSLVIERRD